MRLSHVGIGFGCILGLSSACSSSDNGPKHGVGGAAGTGLILYGETGGASGSAGKGGTGNGAGSGAGGSGTGSTGSSGGAGSGQFNSCTFAKQDAGCASQYFAGETIPLDIYIMFDQSGSMLTPEAGGTTRIDAVRDAVGKFLKDPASIGLGVGIGYFGYEPIGQTTCSPTDYAQPSVKIAPLPGNAQTLIDDLAKRQPTGETPTAAAIQGSCMYAKAWESAHPSHETVILLVTDGKPEAPVTCKNGGCCPTLPDAVAAATACLNGTPGLKTYVLGVGPLLDNLVQIASAGGTQKAYLVSEGDGGDVSSQVLDALNAIRESAQIPCELQIPDAPFGQQLDYGKVNILYTSPTCDVTTLYYRQDSAHCDATSGGWYYDDPQAPKKVMLCGKSCDEVSIPGSKLQFQVGCDSVIMLQ